MRCYTDANLASFADTVLPWLARDPVRNNVACTILDVRVNGYLPTEPDGLWLRVCDEDGELVGVGIRTPPRELLLSTLPLPAARTLAEHVGRIASEIPGVTGPIGEADTFQAAFAAHTGRAPTPGRRSRLFRLDQVTSPSGVPGKARAASTADRDLLIDWVSAFGAEIDPETEPGDPAPAIDGRLRRQNLLWLWEVDGAPTSLAGLSPPVAGVSRVGPVYTPPDLRGRGYASACVAASSQHALDHDSLACMLYTDLTNPISNKIYQQIGYRPVSDAQDWRFGPADDGIGLEGRV